MVCLLMQVKRRLYGTILLLGGVSKTPGLSRYLEWRLATCWKLAPDSTEGIERIEVFRLPPDVPPDCLIWRGASELASLKSARSMWLMSKVCFYRGGMDACACPMSPRSPAPAVMTKRGEDV